MAVATLAQALEGISTCAAISARKSLSGVSHCCKRMRAMVLPQQKGSKMPTKEQGASSQLDFWQWAQTPAIVGQKKGRSPEALDLAPVGCPKRSARGREPLRNLKTVD
eukprot:4125735-Amphidinium_carterae.1